MASAVPKAGLLSAADSLELHVDAYAKRISTSANARAAIQLILEAARSNPDVTVLPAGVTVAYQTLFAEAGRVPVTPPGVPARIKMASIRKPSSPTPFATARRPGPAATRGY